MDILEIDKKANAKSHTHCQVAQKASRTRQNLTISMSLPTLLKRKHGHTTLCINHWATSD